MIGTTKKSSTLITLTTLLKQSKLTQTFGLHNYCWQELVFYIWSGNKVPKFQMVWSEHTTFQKISVWPKRWRDWKLFLLHDNVRPHTVAIIQQFLAKKGGAQLNHPPNSPDLSTPWLFRFPKIKIGTERWPLCYDRRHLDIYNHKIKSVSNFWLRASYETVRRLCQRVYSSVRRLF